MSEIFKAIDAALHVDDWLIALDRDGTLVPYAHRPEEARVDDDLRKLIADLSACKGISVAIISARSAAQLRGDFDGAGAILAGNYGMEIAFPDGTLCIEPQALNAVPSLKTARDELSEKLDFSTGPILEDHGYSLCLHWHNVPLSNREAVHAAVFGTADLFPQLKFRTLPTSYEILPNMAWDKASGLSFIDSNLGGDSGARMRFFAGDTAHDAPGFEWANRNGGISVLVGKHENLGALHTLQTPADLHSLIEYIAQKRGSDLAIGA